MQKPLTLTDEVDPMGLMSIKRAILREVTGATSRDVLRLAPVFPFPFPALVFEPCCWVTEVGL